MLFTPTIHLFHKPIKMKQKVLLLLVCILSLACIQDGLTRYKHYNLEDGVAIQGYDPVSYLNSNKAEKGNPKITVSHQGVVYHFTSQPHKEIFLKQPSRYEPQYGGWCAYAMGNAGEKVDIDPETFKIVDGKLYLFYNAYFNNTLNSWNKDEKNLKLKADRNWAAILKK